MKSKNKNDKNISIKENVWTSDRIIHKKYLRLILNCYILKKYFLKLVPKTNEHDQLSVNFELKPIVRFMEIDDLQSTLYVDVDPRFWSDRTNYK